MSRGRFCHMRKVVGGWGWCELRLESGEGSQCLHRGNRICIRRDAEAKRKTARKQCLLEVGRCGLKDVVSDTFISFSVSLGSGSGVGSASVYKVCRNQYQNTCIPNHVPSVHDYRITGTWERAHMPHRFQGGAILRLGASLHLSVGTWVSVGRYTRNTPRRYTLDTRQSVHYSLHSP